MPFPPRHSPEWIEIPASPATPRTTPPEEDLQGLKFDLPGAELELRGGRGSRRAEKAGKTL